MENENGTTAICTFEAPELLTIEPSKAEIIRATFTPMAEMLAKFDEAFNAVTTEAKTEITKEVTIKAKRLRLDISKVRLATEKLRKDQKEEYLRAGKAIDGVSNILKWAVTDKENKLEEIEKHFEVLEKKRIEALQLERAEALSPFVPDAFERKLSEMEPDVWAAYLASKKKEFDDRIEAQKKAAIEKAERELKEAEARELIRLENEKLRKEAIEREAKAKLEAEARAVEEKARLETEEAERKERERIAKKEREEYEAKLRAEREKLEIERKIMAEAEEKQRKEAEEKLKVEREAKAKLEAEIKARDDAERKAKADREEAERVAAKAEADRIQAELTKGDIAKLNDLQNDLILITSKYSFEADKNKALYASWSAEILAIAARIKAANQ